MGQKTGDKPDSGKKSQGPLLGTIIVTAYGGRNLPNKDLFGRMDPYLCLTLDQVNYQKTTVHKSGGKNPVWNETFALEIYSEGAKRALYIECWDWDRVGKDLVGTNEFLLSRVMKNGGTDFFDWIPLWSSSGKAAGEVRLDIKYIPPPPPKKEPVVPVSPPESAVGSEVMESSYYPVQYIPATIATTMPNYYAMSYKYAPEASSVPYYQPIAPLTFPRPPERKIFPATCGSFSFGSQSKDPLDTPMASAPPGPQPTVNMGASTSQDYVVPCRNASLSRR